MEIVVRRTAAVVTYDSTKVTVQDMIKVLSDFGYSIEGEPKMLR